MNGPRMQIDLYNQKTERCKIKRGNGVKDTLAISKENTKHTVNH